ncbi:unnamed protein product [Ranitomeya imitator]|uniref:Uncharacterized protein n=1 Tax=Ranitomeya imitator TaxID=111125 RepID=A0ABN9M3P4_9NEOB|nr:unnamed protein product [Ranitomeya imitator]
MRGRKWRTRRRKKKKVFLCRRLRLVSVSLNDSHNQIVVHWAGEREVTSSWVSPETVWDLWAPRAAM